MAPFFLLRAPLCANKLSTQFPKTNRLRRLGWPNRGEVSFEMNKYILDEI